MEKYAVIPKIEKGVVFSDPLYDANTLCQYRKEFSASDWLMKLEVNRKTDSFYFEGKDVEFSYLQFNLFLGRPTMMGGTSIKETPDGTTTITRPKHYSVKETEIGMDTACVFCGSMENWEQFGESAALHTGTDGLFGDLNEYSIRGDETPAGYILSGSIDEDFADEQSLFQHFVSSFDGQEISKEQFAEKTNIKSFVLRLAFTKEIRTVQDAANSKEAAPSPEKSEGR